MTLKELKPTVGKKIKLINDIGTYTINVVEVENGKICGKKTPLLRGTYLDRDKEEHNGAWEIERITSFEICN